MQTYKVFWTEDAISDFDSIITHIYTENKTNAKAMYIAIKEQCSTLEHFPFRTRVVPELESLGIMHYRELIFKRWRIIYNVDDDIVNLLLIIDSRQDIQEQLIQRVFSRSHPCIAKGWERGKEE